MPFSVLFSRAGCFHAAVSASERRFRPFAFPPAFDLSFLFFFNPITRKVPVPGHETQLHFLNVSASAGPFFLASSKDVNRQPGVCTVVNCVANGDSSAGGSRHGTAIGQKGKKSVSLIIILSSSSQQQVQSGMGFNVTSLSKPCMTPKVRLWPL